MMLRFVKNGLLIGLLLLASSNNASESKSAARPTVDSLPDRIFGQSGLMRMAAGGAGGPAEIIGRANAKFLREKRKSLLADYAGDSSRHKVSMLNFDREAYILKVVIDLCCTKESNKIDQIYVSDHNTLVGFSYKDSAKSLLPSLDQFDKIYLKFDDSLGREHKECILLEDKKNEIYNTGIELKLAD